MKNFLEEAKKNNDLPIGGGLYVLLHPEAMKISPRTVFKYYGNTRRVPESNAARLGLASHKMRIEIDAPDNASGVLFALAGYAGGLTFYVDEGVLNSEYNLFEIKRTRLKSDIKLPAGKSTIEISFNWKPPLRTPN